MKREKQGKWFMLGDKLYLGEETKDDCISLKLQKWDIMQYGDHGGKKIEFPGEYDVHWVSVTCIEAGDLLHYIVRLEDEQCAIIQDKSVFDVTNFESISQWLVMHEDIEKEIQNLELEGEVVLLS